MIKVTAFVLLLSFANILALESSIFSSVDFDGLELFENDSEKESERDQEPEESEKTFATDSPKQPRFNKIILSASFMGMDTSLLHLSKSYREVTIPPPKL